MSKVSVIVATYNGEQTVLETLRSILTQTHQDLELIVVDDGSTDKTVEVVRAVKDSRIQLILSKNSGSPAAPRNKGINAATGDFIAFCDQDDLWYSEKLEKQLAAYEADANRDDIGIIFSSADLIDSRGTVTKSNTSRFTGFVPNTTAYPTMLNGDFIIACSALVPKLVFDEMGELDETLLGVDDYDLWIRILSEYGVLALPEKLCAWRQSAGALSTDKAKQYIETENVFAKLGDTSEEIRVGHGKNLFRIFMALVLQRKFNDAQSYYAELSDFPVSAKMNSVLRLWSVSRSLTRVWLLILQAVGKVSL